jgi:hypothetical protein
MGDREQMKSAVAATPACLAPEQLEQLVGEPSQTNAHLAACPRCQTELRLLQAFESDAPVPEEGAAVAWISARLERNLSEIKHPSRRRQAVASEAGSWWSRVLAFGKSGALVPVAAILVAAVAGVFLLRPTAEPELRAGLGNKPVFRSQQVELAGPSGELAEAPQVLHWQGFPNATSYRVVIMEVDRVPLWSAATTTLEATLPPPVHAKIVVGKPFLWQVTALDAQGTLLAASPLERFVVTRKGSEPADSVPSQR